MIVMDARTEEKRTKRGEEGRGGKDGRMRFKFFHLREVREGVRVEELRPYARTFFVSIPFSFPHDSLFYLSLFVCVVSSSMPSHLIIYHRLLLSFVACKKNERIF